MEDPSPAPIRLIVAAGRVFRKKARVGRFWVHLWGGLLALFLVFEIARLGSLVGRGSALLLLFGVLVGAVLLSLRERRAERDILRNLRSTYGRLWPDLGARVERTFLVHQRLGHEAHRSEGSRELALYEMERLLDGAPAEELVRAAEARGRTYRRIGWAGALLVAVLGSFASLRFVEGALILAATKGEAPGHVGYAVELLATSEPPSYMRGEPANQLLFRDSETLPYGARITVRFAAKVVRNFVLVAGSEEVPFVSDGSGALVAHLTARESLRLRIAARFGEVLVFDRYELALQVIQDEAPEVTVEGAPREVKWLELSRLPLHYRARDDHGLTEIDVVLRSGQREERKKLVELDSGRREYEGAYAVTSSHKLLRGAFLPVRVVIEARDNDRESGSKWGRSAEIVIQPPEIGEFEQNSHESLLTFRRAAVDAYAREVEQRPGEAPPKKGKLSAAFEKLKSELELLPEPPQGTLSFLAAQVDSVERKGDLETFENVVLATDTVIGTLARRQVKTVSRKLGAAVRELGSSFHRLTAEVSEEELRDSVDLLRRSEQGSEHLTKIGSLGADLGGVAAGDLGRIRRLSRAKEYSRAEKVALHLAQRLERATPSFGSKGGSGGGRGGGGGSTEGGGEGAGSGESSSLPEQAGDAARATEKLAKDHEQQISELETMLEQARRAAMRDAGDPGELEREAEALRDGMMGLPDVGPGPGTAGAEAAEGRRAGDAMADSLARGEIERALTRGRQGKQALERARRLAKSQGASFSEGALNRAEAALNRALEKSEELRQRYAEAMKKNLGEGSRSLSEREQRLQERARELGKKMEGLTDREKQGAMEQATERMNDAAQSLREGNGEKAARELEEAQRELEAAQGEKDSSEEDSDEGGDSEEGSRRAKNGEVPGEEEDRARAFRERVQKGLGRNTGHLAGAASRYAEELE